jgi:hypothetical protein
MFGKHHSPSEFVRAEGVVLETPRSSQRAVKIRYVVGVKFDDGQKVKFTQEIDKFFFPSERNALHAVMTGEESIPMLWLYVGDKIPVLYDPADRTRMVIDELPLREAGMRKHIEEVQARQARSEAILDASEPVPGHHSAADRNGDDDKRRGDR